MAKQSSKPKKLKHQADINDFKKPRFAPLRGKYKEKIAQIALKMEEVRSETSVEYLSALAPLQYNMRTREEVFAKMRQMRLDNVQRKFDAEEFAIRQDFENSKQIVIDSIKADLEDKLRRLEEDRDNYVPTEPWEKEALKRKKKKPMDLFGDKEEQVTVSGPYLVYMLNDEDIAEDLAEIKNGKAFEDP